MNTIKFGTDGWRDVIADGFTFENVKRVAQAACDVVRKNSKSRLILIGYDRRFFSKKFAETSAQVATANGFRVEIAEEPIGSPTLSYQVKDRRAAIGFMITASHNPAHFNGFKLKGPHGGSVDETVTTSVEDRLDVGEIQTDGDFGKKADFFSSYASHLKKLARPDLSKLKSPVVFDAMHGPGAALFTAVAGSNRAVVIRSEVDPLFGGVNPEPIESNLQALKAAVLANKAAVGLAVDGDADRIGVLDEKGRFLPPHTVMPLLLLHLIENKKLKGKVVQTVSMGYLPQRIAAHYNMPFEEVSVGFKHIAKKMGEEKVLLGGEESGGYGVGLWFPERDGVLCALLLLEYMTAKKMPLSALVDDLYKRFGASHFRRVDFPVSEPVSKTEWTAHRAPHVGPMIGALKVKNVNTSDGIKITMENDAWVLLRPSGTEPLIRTYSEAGSPAEVDLLLAEAERLTKIPPPSSKKADGKKTKSRRNSK